ncbi:muts domain V-domain-containing protein [Cristinia sonorae]|uniref:DNA mismatch repair protein MSH3 n=1 Tax=Cristinia sonorae TaxID=1940300 RepID=A0A8K0XQM1_9AGAR|nr:muts domain V-domain-containing protein [Cristinia sonorae]
MSLRPSSSREALRPWTGNSTNRLLTAQSRPTTAAGRPQTAASSRHEASYVVAVLEGRGVGRDVGIAALDKETGRLNLIQLSDSPTYVKTLQQLHIHSPSLILVPDTFLSVNDVLLASGGKKPTTTPVLVQCILEEFDYLPVEPVLRRYWNDISVGLEFVNQLCVDGDERAATIVAASAKYYALSATSALLKYAELKMNTRFAAASLRIRYEQGEGTMMIDPETVRNLELVGNMTSKRSSHSLFGILNHTYTAMAARLLRVNLLAPITNQSAIDARLDVVEELIQTEDRFNDVKDALKSLNRQDFDKLIASLCSSEATEASTSKIASTRVAQMLNLRCIVKNLPLLAAALAGSRTQMLQVIEEMISDERIEKIHQLISDSLNDEATHQKGGGLTAVTARVYAVKANFNHLLDVARETYKEDVGDIFTLSQELTQEHGIPLTLLYQDSGFVFQLKKSDLEGELPKGFIDVTFKKGKYTFSSLELKKRNARMKDALEETLMLSDRVIQSLVSEVVSNIGALYKASEAVAMVDMLWSLAHAAILHNYVRPEFTGTLAIKAGRHPILEGVQAAGTLVPNDVYCCEASSFQIVQGPNMSVGKSTYLRQIGLLTVMALCGSFVPAEYGSFRRVVQLHDALLTRLSNDDDMEKSLSTFANEMASSAMIIGLATSDSLILIDEVGRGTSPLEGVGISHAIAEALIKAKAYVFFATHFSELSTTLSRQPSVVNLHLSVQKTRHTSTNLGMRFQYKIVDGAPQDSDHYGLDLARLADLPDDVLLEAKRVSDRLTELEKRKNEESKTTKLAIRRQALLRLKTQLTQALDHSALPEEDLRAYIARFQREITKTLHETL